MTMWFVPAHLIEYVLSGPISVRQPSSSTPQGSQVPQAGTTPQPPQAPCPDTPTQSGGVEVRGPENGTQAPQSEEEKEEGTESSVLTVPEVIVLDDNGQDVLETDAADGTVEKSVVTEKPNPEENQSTVTDEPDAEKTDIVLEVTPLSEKRKFATVYEPGAKQYKRMRVTGPHAMKSVAAVRAALIGAARPKPPSRYRLHPEPRERSASNYSEMWARKSFDAWRAQNGVPTELSIEDLSEQEDVTPFVDQLCEFMSQLTKQNGQLYPPTRCSLFFSQCLSYFTFVHAYGSSCLGNEMCRIRTVWHIESCKVEMVLMYIW